MKLTHELFIEIIRKLNLPVLDGVCYGYAALLSQFICRERQAEFFYLLDKIKRADNSELLLRALEQDNRESHELKNFFVEIAHYQSPEDDKDALIQQQNIETISKKLASRDVSLSPHLIKQTPLAVVYKKPFLLNKIELINYLNDLQKQLEKASEVPVAIHLGNDLHVICIQYDFKIKRWLNRDIALLENESYQQDSYSTSELADSIFLSLFDIDEEGTPSEYTGFGLSIIVSCEHVAKLQALFSNASLKVPKLEEQLLRENARQMNLLQMSEAHDCTDEFIKILSQHHINPNATYLNGDTLLHRACIHNSLERVNALLSHPKIRVNEQDFDGYSPLARACASGYLDIITTLLAHKEIDPNAWDAFNQTPLHAACVCASLGGVNALLLHEKIDPNQPDIEGLTPLDSACISGNVEIVKALLAHPETRTDISSADGYTPLSRYYENGDIIKVLLTRKDADPNIWDTFDQTPLHAACIDGDLERVNALLSHKKINPEMPDAEGFTPLDRACGSGNIEIVKALLAHPKTRSDVPRADGLTSLERTHLLGFVEIEKALLTHQKATTNTHGSSNKFSKIKAPCFFQNRRKNNNQNNIYNRFCL